MSLGHNDQRPITLILQVHKPSEAPSRYDQNRTPVNMDFRRSSIGVLIAAMMIVMPLAVRGVQQTPASTESARPAVGGASIKQNKSLGGSGSMGRRPGGRIFARNVPLRVLVMFAYDLRGY